MPAVVLSGVTKAFAGRPALSGIDAAISEGVITGLAGPDGAGKTTLMRLMAGLLRPDAGRVSVLGHDPLTDTGLLRLRVGYMPQKFGLYEDLSVMENLTLHADLRGVTSTERGSTFSRLLEFTDLGPFTARMAGHLSGGMKQKLGLACALLGKPDLLLLDEPGVGVDPISRRALWKMVRSLSSEGLTVVWSTAYLDEAEICDSVLLLNEGKLLFVGEPKELTGRLAGRSLCLRGVTDHRRQVLSHLLALPQITDGVIQGASLRAVLAPGAAPPDPASLGLPGTPSWHEVPSRFEDAFIDLLGGGPGGGSALAEAMPDKPSRPENLIEAIALTKKFGTFTAADRITFSVRQGEIFGLLGPNGAGKSTTFKMMCGLLRPTSGQALVMGIDLAKSPARARQRLGYMAQKFSLYGALTARQNLEFFSGVYGLAPAGQRRAVDAMTAAFKLEPFLATRADNLPLGFKQRLALACAVMHGPDILFLDEPTSGVDPVTRREFWGHINAMVGKGVTVMVTTHFMEEAEYCDRIGLINQGRLIALAPPDELKALASSPALPDPAMEDAFITLISNERRQQEQA